MNKNNLKPYINTVCWYPNQKGKFLLGTGGGLVGSTEILRFFKDNPTKIIKK